MEFFPLYLRLQQRAVLVVGGGEVAARKVRLLHRAGALIHVVSPKLCEELKELAACGDIRWEQRLCEASDVNPALALVIAATNDDAINARLAQWAQAAHVWVNVVDHPALCSAITPAIVDRSPLIVAISSGGTAPVYIRRLRAWLEQQLPANLGQLLSWAGGWRRRIRTAVPQSLMRLRLWEWVFEGPVSTQVLAGQSAVADAMLAARLHRQAATNSGEVWLVGAGPGDPDLLTVRAMRRLQQADVVVYDRLVGDKVMNLVRRDAERIDVGKRRANHTLPQEDINALLVKLAREGKRVLRLKGGDPFVFGRGGEEISELMEAGVPFEVIPGITAANGASSYAGIPLTHRDHAQSCIFVTGHPRENGELQLPWSALVNTGQTVVIYMGVSRLADICSRLIEAGAPHDRPAALIENATREDQRVIVANLSTLPVQPAIQDVQGPGLVIVGDVVRLRSQLSWRG